MDTTVPSSKGHRQHRHRSKKRRKRRTAAQREVGEGFFQVNGDDEATLVTNPERLLPDPNSPVLDQSLVTSWRLASDLRLKGDAVFADGEKPTLTKLISVEDLPPQKYVQQLTPFAKLLSIVPTERFHLETTAEVLETRVVELVAPIGKGQRCLIVAPPKAG
ncbi:MAG: hypothetical protein ACUVRY_02130 [Thermoanaerobaculaceae bacterium]